MWIGQDAIALPLALILFAVHIRFDDVFEDPSAALARREGPTTQLLSNFRRYGRYEQKYFYYLPDKKAHPTLDDHPAWKTLRILFEHSLRTFHSAETLYPATLLQHVSWFTRHSSLSPG